MSQIQLQQQQKKPPNLREFSKQIYWEKWIKNRADNWAKFSSTINKLNIDICRLKQNTAI